ncbi:MAG: NAD-dependent 4,6-dehydratase LegB [Candidatus Cloacimonetes bacterium]|jgi:NAD dependent epimerase/dehydratase|nr:NAD-dependent 4,6-dehydratase LegB [Candidatus Cloacimonadota bacterium]
MKALVTGADGFIGSHLTEMLLKNGYKVRALAQYNSFNYWGWLEDVPENENLEVVCGDIRDSYFCHRLCRDVDMVFHLAALIAIPFSYQAPQSYVDTNIQGTLNICQASLDNKLHRIICTSTSEVYGTAQYVPIDEKHPLQPQSPYSASKIGADAVAMSFFHAFNLPLTIARPFNTYGPRQSARAVIPTIITQIAAGIKEIRLGDTSPTRDFNYVEDTCRGFLELAKCEDAVGETVNIGSNFEISIRETLDLIKDIMHSDVYFVSDEQRIRPKKSEVFRLWCDNTKIKSFTGFEPKYGIREGLEKTVEWFVKPENLAKYKAGMYNV